MVLKHLMNLAANNPDSKNGYELGITSGRAFLFTTSEYIDRALENNKLLCFILSCLRGNDYIFSNCDSVNLNCQPNVRQLMERHEMLHHIEQRTEQWFAVWQKALVTASSVYNAVGLRTSKEQKERAKGRFFILCSSL